MIRRARAYFPDESAAEMMIELRPYLCPHDQSVFFGQGILTLFLPVLNYKLGNSAERFGNYEACDFSWLEEMLSVWSWMEKTPAWDTLSIRLFARAAKSAKNLSWEPYISTMFSKYVFNLNLNLF